MILATNNVSAHSADRQLTDAPPSPPWRIKNCQKSVLPRSNERGKKKKERKKAEGPKARRRRWLFRGCSMRVVYETTKTTKEMMDSPGSVMGQGSRPSGFWRIPAFLVRIQKSRNKIKKFDFFLLIRFSTCAPCTCIEPRNPSITSQHISRSNQGFRQAPWRPFCLLVHACRAGQGR